MNPPLKLMSLALAFLFAVFLAGCGSSSGGSGGGACCKICTTGKACGDTCISKSYSCNVGPGCACNG